MHPGVSAETSHAIAYGASRHVGWPRLTHGRDRNMAAFAQIKAKREDLTCTKPQVSTYKATLTADVHDALPRRRARCVPDGPGFGSLSAAAVLLLNSSAMACCRSSLPCR
jgi:hypothetical protein